MREKKKLQVQWRICYDSPSATGQTSGTMFLFAEDEEKAREAFRKTHHPDAVITLCKMEVA